MTTEVDKDILLPLEDQEEIISHSDKFELFQENLVKIFEHFQKSDDERIIFPPLNIQLRYEVHNRCKDFGFYSFTVNENQVTVTKTNPPSSAEHLKKSVPTSFSICSEDLFQGQNPKNILDTEKTKMIFSDRICQCLHKLRQNEVNSVAFPPMDTQLREYIHKLATERGYISHSFCHGDKKFPVVFKQESAPNKESLMAVGGCNEQTSIFP